MLLLLLVSLLLLWLLLLRLLFACLLDVWLFVVLRSLPSFSLTGRPVFPAGRCRVPSLTPRFVVFFLFFSRATVMKGSLLGSLENNSVYKEAKLEEQLVALQGARGGGVEMLRMDCVGGVSGFSLFCHSKLTNQEGNTSKVL